LIFPNGVFDEPTGQARIINVFNLLSKYVIHAVGPIVSGSLTEENCQLLASCYNSCLEVAAKNQCKSIAFAVFQLVSLDFQKKKKPKLRFRSFLSLLSVKEFNFNVKPIINQENPKNVKKREPQKQPKYRIAYLKKWKEA
jgi:hypothetical protein